MDSGLLIIISGAIIVHLCQNSTLLALLKVHLRYGLSTKCKEHGFHKVEVSFGGLKGASLELSPLYYIARYVVEGVTVSVTCPVYF